jgi:23S rRNA pseudouridine955/2504/2580 synthase
MSRAPMPGRPDDHADPTPGQRVEVTVPPSLAGSRVDRLLRKLLPGVPLSRIHRMLREGDVRRGPARLKGSDRTEAGDVLTLRLAPDDAAELSALLACLCVSARRQAGEGLPAVRHGLPRVAAEATLSLPVLYEDEHIIALDKPTGVACHPGSSHPLAETVLGALLAALSGPRRDRPDRALTAGECTATFRPSLVGRLDRDTSGVQLAGRSLAALRGLEALSRAHEIRKTYLALARDRPSPRLRPAEPSVASAKEGGRMLPDSGRVDLPLVDLGSGGARMVVASGAGADEGAPASEAVTDYRVLGRAGGASLVEVEPVTGRRHQIRAHFAHLGAHLAGDVRYGDRAWNAEIKRRTGLGRLFLHCARASFSHPLTGATTTISSPLPSDLASVLTKLGISLPETYNP